jgi:hypothetical protein
VDALLAGTNVPERQIQGSVDRSKMSMEAENRVEGLFTHGDKERLLGREVADSWIGAKSRIL